MSDITVGINIARERILAILQKSNPDKNNNRFFPADHRGTGWWDIPVENSSNIEFRPTPEVFPLQTWTLSGEVNAKLRSLFEVGIEGNFTLVQLSDATYQLTINGGVKGNISIPLTNFGAGSGIANTITFNLSPDEVAFLAEGYLPIPEDALMYNVDPSNVNYGDIFNVDNIDSIATSGSLSLALDGINIPIPSTDVTGQIN